MNTPGQPMRLFAILLLLAASIGYAQAQQQPAKRRIKSTPSKFDGIPLEAQQTPVPATPIDTFAGRPVYAYAEQQPMYPGGVEQMQAFLMRQLRYPPQYARTTIEGRVFVSFIVDRDGQIQRPTILKSLAEYCDAEALRVVRLLPRFTPGYRAGQSVDVRYVVALRFDCSQGWQSGNKPKGRRRQ
ncbi:energy transducer TonB [Hymenobacter jeollabukensis]|uniref:Energy transducer TonB n=1 Tax=Hymenobacter jeollabukensis TaxID=2025313 RepID=A0A5R8WSN8_9BACT|nr:energy transducer TonB [Hymenobacter jeollabukensis]TLM93946.1 energy transducer TonB [Hymenobacter jeollabukensis]